MDVSVCLSVSSHISETTLPNGDRLCILRKSRPKPQFSTPASAHSIDSRRRSPKNVTGDYVGDCYPNTKFDANQKRLVISTLLSKVKEFSRSQAVVYIVKVVTSRKPCHL